MNRRRDYICAHNAGRRVASIMHAIRESSLKIIIILEKGKTNFFYLIKNDILIGSLR